MVRDRSTWIEGVECSEFAAFLTSQRCVFVFALCLSAQLAAGCTLKCERLARQAYHKAEAVDYANPRVHRFDRTAALTTQLVSVIFVDAR